MRASTDIVGGVPSHHDDYSCSKAVGGFEFRNSNPLTPALLTSVDVAMNTLATRTTPAHGGTYRRIIRSTAMVTNPVRLSVREHPKYGLGSNYQSYLGLCVRCGTAAQLLYEPCGTGSARTIISLTPTPNTIVNATNTNTNITSRHGYERGAPGSDRNGATSIRHVSDGDDEVGQD